MRARDKKRAPLDTRNLARRMRCAIGGLILIALVGCSSGSTPSDTAKASATTPSGGAQTRLTVTSSITDGAHLHVPVPWSAQPSQDVASVDFIVDGKVRWVERNAPYFFNDDNNLLPPWVLGGGAHTLTVRATSASGATATATSHVTVTAAPAVPRALLATFRRTLTKAQLNNTSSMPGYDPNNQPPAGLWTIRFATNYLIALGDPSNAADENEAFEANTAGDLTLAGPANWLTPPDLRGGLCEPAPVDHYRWVLNGNVLTITGGTNCPNRKALFDGTWTRR